jgi:hypothetical protein
LENIAFTVVPAKSEVPAYAGTTGRSQTWNAIARPILTFFLDGEGIFGRGIAF